MCSLRFFTRTSTVTLIALSVLCSNCTLVDRVLYKGGHTVEVAKPRVHKSWYKKSRWHRRIHIGKYQLRVFEKQGVKKVRMRS